DSVGQRTGVRVGRCADHAAGPLLGPDRALDRGARAGKYRGRWFVCRGVSACGRRLGGASCAAVWSRGGDTRARRGEAGYPSTVGVNAGRSGAVSGWESGPGELDYTIVVRYIIGLCLLGYRSEWPLGATR